MVKPARRRLPLFQSRRVAKGAVLILALVSVWSLHSSFSGLQKYVAGGDVNIIGNATKTPKTAKERRALWMHLKDELVICQLVPVECTDQWVLISAAKMHHDVWRVGSHLVCFLAFLCAGVGIYLSSLGVSIERNAPRFDQGKTNNVFSRLNENIYGKLMNWWSTDLTFTRPGISMKIFVASLLWFELQCMSAPSQNILATPEIVALMRHLPETKSYVPPLADWLLPNSADKSIQRLATVRNIMLVSWLAYLLLPLRRHYALGSCYAIGAVSYCYLGSIGLMYKLSHSAQAGMLFVFAAIPAVPFLDTNPRAAAWLRKFLFVGILIPIYLFSGIAKIRYLGVLTNITGSWLKALFKPGDKKRQHAALQSVRAILYNHHILLTTMSLGNLFLELLLPFALLLSLRSPRLRGMFHVTSILFHISIFFLIGPNFARCCLLHLLACDPIGFYHRKSTAPPRQNNCIRFDDWLRVGVGMFFVAGWFKVQVLSDAYHLMGWRDRLKKMDPYWPWPEMSMFASAKDPDYISSSILVAGAICALCFSIIRAN